MLSLPVSRADQCVVETKEVRRLCREAGVLVGAGGTFANVIRIQPPLTLSAAEADRIESRKGLATLRVQRTHQANQSVDSRSLRPKQSLRYRQSRGQGLGREHKCK